jgi:hypothetical protein
LAFVELSRRRRNDRSLPNLAGSEPASKVS